MFGKFVLVDPVDVPKIQRHKWHLHTPKPGVFYAAATVTRQDDTQTAIEMHKLILDAGPDDRVDRRNGNGLDNRRHNLRQASTQQNAQNLRKTTRPTSSRYKDVNLIRNRKLLKPWRAGIAVNDKLILLGYYASEDEAAMAYDRAAHQFFGEFAKLNFPFVKGIKID